MHLRKISLTALITIVLVILAATLASSFPDGAEFSLPAASAGQIRVVNRGGYGINVVQFKRTEYVGDCPGVEFKADTGKAQFTSTTTPPAPGRRVVIKNITQGIDDDPYPYTDREYDDGQYSEGFIFALDSRHQVRTFSVLEGENQFIYEIKEGDEVIESGSFTAQVQYRNTGALQRNKVCKSVTQCNQNPTDWLNDPPPFPPQEPIELVGPDGVIVLLEDFELPEPEPPETCFPKTECHCVVTQF